MSYLVVKVGTVNIVGREGGSDRGEPDGERIRDGRDDIVFVDARRPTVVPAHSHVLVIKMNLFHHHKKQYPSTFNLFYYIFRCV